MTKLALVLLIYITHCQIECNCEDLCYSINQNQSQLICQCNCTNTNTNTPTIGPIIIFRDNSNDSLILAMIIQTAIGCFCSCVGCCIGSAVCFICYRRNKRKAVLINNDQPNMNICPNFKFNASSIPIVVTDYVTPVNM